MIGVPLAARPNDNDGSECESWVNNRICVHTIGKGHVREAPCVLNSVVVAVSSLCDDPELDGDPLVIELALRMADDPRACVNFREYTFVDRLGSRRKLLPLSAVPFLGAYKPSVEISEQANADEHTRGPRPCRYQHS